MDLVKRNRRANKPEITPTFYKNLVTVAILSLSVGPLSAAFAHEIDQDIERVDVFGTQQSLKVKTASRLDLTVLETPASVEVISGESIRARVDNSVLEAVTRTASFTAEATPGNGHSSISARGFRGQGSVTKLYDGSHFFTAAGTITFPFDTWGVERIDVLKGPASVLYGEGGIGGAINIVPKTPEYHRQGAVRLGIGENRSRFLGLDYNDKFSDSLAYRVNYSKQASDNWVVNGESEAEMLSLALRWDPTDNLSIVTRYDRGDQEPMKYFGVPINNGKFIKSLTDKNFNVDDSQITYRDESFRLKADWSLSEVSSWQTEVYRLSTDRYWANSEYYTYNAPENTIDRWDPLVLTHDMTQNGLRSNLNVALQEDLLKFSVGFEINDIEFSRDSNFGPANSNPIDWSNDFDTVLVDEFYPGLLSDITDAGVMLDNMSDVLQKALFGELQYQITDAVDLVTALRYDEFSTDYLRLGQAPIEQESNATTGRLGLVYSLSENAALYAQYGTGATHPGGSIVTANASYRESNLIESEQWEIGFKKQVSDTGLQWTLALFDLTRNNLTEDDPDSSDPNDVIVIAEQTSQGIEVGFNYMVNEDVQFYGNLSVLEAETDSGSTPNYIPEKTANVGFTWRPVHAVRFIADARYVGMRYHSTNPIPSFTLVDASVSWQVTHHIAVTAKVDNLFDELYASSAYYSNTWLVGKPRTFSLVADYRF